LHISSLFEKATDQGGSMLLNVKFAGKEKAQDNQ
jgi:hypothetical protein